MKREVRKLAGLDESYALNAAITFVAIVLFVVVGTQVIPADILGRGFAGAVPGPLSSALILNIALVILAWRRTAELRGAKTGKAQAEKRAHELAYTDDTTGLFNRRHLNQKFEEADTGPGCELTLLLIDIDHFKIVNDLYGHSTGDHLLAEIARKIVTVTPPGSCCVRLGGDEFAILLEGQLAHAGYATAIAERLLDVIDEPVQLAATQARVSASIGLSTLNTGVETAASLMRRSDIAMYVAKNRGRNCLVWFDDDMQHELAKRNTLENEIRTGIAENQFVPYFQPLLDIESGRLKGFEVLARWEHPERGLVEPDEFIPVAEATGMISELSMAVTRKALLCSRNWASDLTIAVNISPIQFKDPMLALRIIQMLLETGFPPKRLELELTESTLLENPEQAMAMVETLKHRGIRISLDDFGTGYASLTQLRSLPFDCIKIDRSFVSTLLEDKQSNAIVHAITTLGRNLNLPITAEGVESEEVYQKLQSLGCSHAQGWLFGKAISAEETERVFLSMGMPPQEPALEPTPPTVDIQARPTMDRRDFARRGR